MSVKWSVLGANTFRQTAARMPARRAYLLAHTSSFDWRNVHCIPLPLNQLKSSIFCFSSARVISAQELVKAQLEAGQTIDYCKDMAAIHSALFLFVEQGVQIKVAESLKLVKAALKSQIPVSETSQIRVEGRAAFTVHSCVAKGLRNLLKISPRMWPGCFSY